MTTLYRRINIEKRGDVNYILDSKIFEVGDVIELEHMRINYKDPRSENYSNGEGYFSDRRDKQFIVIERKEIKVFDRDPIISFVLKDKPSVKITHQYNLVRIDDPSIWINNVPYRYIRLDSYKELIFESKIPQ